MQIIVLSLIYVLGAVLSFLMARTEIAAEQEPYTIGTRLLTITFSLLSFAFVLIILIRAWIKLIQATGYWDKPITKEQKQIIIENKIGNGTQRNYSTAKN